MSDVSDPQSSPAATPPEPAPALPPPQQSRRWSTIEMWTLGVFSALGLAGFIATFVLIVMRSPHAEVPRALSAVDVQRLAGPPGERGPAGPAGPPGPRGAAGSESSIRIVRADCGAGSCVAECDDDEILLSAYCSPNRPVAAYFPSEHSASCRLGAARGGHFEVVAACVRAKR
jgi:hypothetical protein